MKRRARHCLLCIGVLLGILPGSSTLTAAPPARQSPAAGSSNPDEFDVYLLTVGLGGGVEARFGHTILRLVHQTSGRDHNFNWGMFSFNDPYLPLNFFLGRLRYWVSDEPYTPMLRRYLFYEKRPVFSDKLNLAPGQKRVLMSKIETNMQGDNIYFWYQYFYQNCATIPRDYIDAALGGKISERFSQEFTTTTFRDYVRANLNRPPVAGFLLDIVMNGRLDKPLSKWVEMFYPPKLREYLATLPAWDDQGREIPGLRLLSDGKRLNDLPDVPSSSTFVHPWFLGVGLSLISLMAALFASSRGNPDTRLALLPFVGMKVLGCCLLLWGLFAGILGTVMAVSWMFSEHLDLLHNANLWLFWPVDGLYLVLGIALLRHSRQRRTLGRLQRLGAALGALHLLAFVVFTALRLIGVIEQNVDQVLTFIGPVACGLYLLHLSVVKLTAVAPASSIKVP